MLATASNAIIIGFNVRPDNNAITIAEKEELIFDYIELYNAIEDMEDAKEGYVEPEYKEASARQIRQH